eukprot:gnl/MRDRNA2_/MRDRNA2_91777_c0_seq1.p1 gnl/MRDRNA2_/MRDRNA2_91777_c0~~gnl/MRDRNA2_/MRDRNA2_91777_c0_seq1.p1  ORF type:complete len:340 (-),score=104.19 gnl/MRDRNA2_/MRDRNA2_91777_c0_seq1:130-1149(-)
MSDFSGPAITEFRPPPGLSLPGDEEDSLYTQFPNLAWKHDALDANVNEITLEQVPKTDDQEDIPAAELDPISSNKEVRKLEKKLRDISKLETKVTAGEKVDPLQLKKIEKKQEIEDELSALKERLMSEMMEAESQNNEDLMPPPGFHKLPADKLAALSTLRAGAFAMDACEDDATTLPGSTASDQGGDSDSESLMSTPTVRQLSACAPIFVPQAPSSFMPMMPMPFVPLDMAMSRTPLRNTAALFTPATGCTIGQMSKDAPEFIPTAYAAMESCVPKAEEEKITWRSTRSKKQMLPEETGKTKLTAGSAELFVPQFPDLKASVQMKSKEKIKAKKVTQI